MRPGVRPGVRPDVSLVEASPPTGRVTVDPGPVLRAWTLSQGCALAAGRQADGEGGAPRRREAAQELGGPQASTVMCIPTASSAEMETRTSRMASDGISPSGSSWGCTRCLPQPRQEQAGRGSMWAPVRGVLHLLRGL